MTVHAYSETICAGGCGYSSPYWQFVHHPGYHGLCPKCGDKAAKAYYLSHPEMYVTSSIPKIPLRLVQASGIVNMGGTTSG